MKRSAKQQSPVFYDCQASSGGGLPIEIGWAFADPVSGEIHSESHLIKPPSHWDLASAWDPSAESLHKIARHELDKHGRAPTQIASHMNRALAGRELFSDHPLDDERLWFMMWQASGAPIGRIGDVEGICMVEPTFKMRPLNANSLMARLALRRGWNGADFEAAKVRAAHACPRMHRAEADARHLATLWQITNSGL